MAGSRTFKDLCSQIKKTDEHVILGEADLALITDTFELLQLLALVSKKNPDAAFELAKAKIDLISDTKIIANFVKAADLKTLNKLKQPGSPQSSPQKEPESHDKKEEKKDSTVSASIVTIYDLIMALKNLPKESDPSQPLQSMALRTGKRYELAKQHIDLILDRKYLLLVMETLPSVDAASIAKEKIHLLEPKDFQRLSLYVSKKDVLGIIATANSKAKKDAEQTTFRLFDHSITADSPCELHLKLPSPTDRSPL